MFREKYVLRPFCHVSVDKRERYVAGQRKEEKERRRGEMLVRRKALGRERMEERDN